MTPNEFQKLCLRTEVTPAFVNMPAATSQTPGDHDRRVARLLHGMIGVCTEAGELQDMVKKHLVYGKSLDLTNVMEECFDVMWYVSLCLDAAGFSMEEAMERGIAKLRARYPNGFTEEAALNRDLVKERTELERR
jgi:NTP pyrophosphatase (non-canonical NTP hydrolase)